jgi:hypothetical protein
MTGSASSPKCRQCAAARSVVLPIPSIGTIPSRSTFFGMTDNSNPFAEFDLERVIALRWTLRDIKAKRLKLSPVSDGDLRALIDMGLVEMRDDVPVLTNAGHDALD